jgi:hypothetical protein
MKIKVQARNLQPGDVTGSGETITCVFPNPRIHGKHQAGKVEVGLSALHKLPRVAIWGAYTEIGVERAI